MHFNVILLQLLGWNCVECVVHHKTGLIKIMIFKKNLIFKNLNLIFLIYDFLNLMC